jgi:hypothetical protein
MAALVSFVFPIKKAIKMEKKVKFINEKMAITEQPLRAC